jgi:hypothetical protein
LDDALQDFNRERFNIDPVGNPLIGHDRRRVGIDENGDYSFFAKGFAGLGSGIVEFGSLTNDNRSGPDY